MPVPGPMRMQGWEESSGSWKPLALKGTETEALVLRRRGLRAHAGPGLRSWGCGWGGSVGGRGEDSELEVDSQVPQAALSPLNTYTSALRWHPFERG